MTHYWRVTYGVRGPKNRFASYGVIAEDIREAIQKTDAMNSARYNIGPVTEVKRVGPVGQEQNIREDH